MRKTRRNFLQNVALAVTSLPLSPTLLANYRFSENPFKLGVASGSATHDSIVLWTRLLAAKTFESTQKTEVIPVKWELAESSEFKPILQSGISNAFSELAYSVHVEVSGLKENTTFFYRFTVGDFSSPVGKTRTFYGASEGTDQRLRIGVASCQHFERGYFNSYPHLIDDNPDLVLFLGDYIYEYAPTKAGVRAHRGDWCLSLADYRDRYAQYRQDKDLQAAHAHCPWLIVWDDHEVQNDYAGRQQGSQGPTTDFQRRRAAAYQAFYEHMPLKSSVLTKGSVGLSSGTEMRIYDHYRVGRLLSISMLDTRQYRSPQACNLNDQSGSSTLELPACEALADVRRTMLGEPQEKWLGQQMSHNKDYSWNLIAQTTLFGSRRFPGQDGSNRIWNDGWDGYPAARQRLIEQLIKNSVSNPIILGGDVHGYYVGHLLESYEKQASKPIGFEIITSSISGHDGYKITPAFFRRNPHFFYAEGARRGYVMIDLTSQEMRIALRSIRNQRTPESQIETLAEFRITSGRLALEHVLDTKRQSTQDEDQSVTPNRLRS